MPGPSTIDAYLAELPPSKRAALQRLREQIQAIVPDAVETILHGTPAFRLDGRFFLGFSATKDGCSFYTDRGPVEAYAEKLAAFSVLRGTIRFSPDRPLPTRLVAGLIRARLAERRPAGQPGLSESS